MLVLSQAEVEKLLDLDALVEAVAAAMVDLSAGRASMPARVAADVEERSRSWRSCRPTCRPSAR